MNNMIIQQLTNGFYKGKLSNQLYWIISESRQYIIDNLLEDVRLVKCCLNCERELDEIEGRKFCNNCNKWK